MAINYTATHMQFAQPTDADEDHGDELRANWDIAEALLAPDYMYFVSTQFTSVNLDNGGEAHDTVSDQRYFSTIQAAIDAAEDGEGYTRRVIFVYPGTYVENLTVTESLAIVGLPPVHSYRSYFGAGVSIIGTTLTQDPTITFTPSAVAQYLTLANLHIRNQYISSGTTIDKALMLLATGYASGTLCQVTAGGCTFWGQARQDGHKWTAGIWGDGGMVINLLECQIKGDDWCNGNNNGGVKWPVYIYGGGANRKGYANIRRCELANTYGGGGTLGTDYGVIKIDNTASCNIMRSTVEYERQFACVDGGTGTNNFYGASSDPDADYFLNIFSSDWSLM